LALGKKSYVGRITDGKAQPTEDVESFLREITECMLSPKLAVTAAIDGTKLTTTTHQKLLVSRRLRNSRLAFTQERFLQLLAEGNE
jgi:hypothetical protein